VKKVLFVCVENAGRSQMAEAFANKYGKNKFVVSSAGNMPAENVNPVVVEVMKEKGIDISTNKPKLLTFQMAQDVWPAPQKPKFQLSCQSFDRISPDFTRDYGIEYQTASSARFSKQITIPESLFCRRIVFSS